MKKLFTINNKDIYDQNMTILYTSDFNYTTDAIEFLNQHCTVIDKINRSNIKEVNKKILEKFHCTNLLEKEILTKNDEIKINILSNLETNNKIIVFFNVLTYLDKKFVKQLLTYLKEKNIRIINYTSDIEETLYFEYIMVVNKDKIMMEGNKKDILQEEKILKKLGFGLPAIVELSNGLKYYNLVSKPYFDSESLVNDLWN